MNAMSEENDKKDAQSQERRVEPLHRKDKEKDDDSTKVAGYEVKKLAQAPFSPPQPKETESKDYTSNKTVKVTFGAGAFITAIGILFMLTFSPWLGLAVLLVGASLVIGAVFFPIK